MNDLKKIIDRAALNDSDRQKLQALLESYCWLQGEIQSKNVSIKRLRKMIFGTSKTEKIKTVLNQENEEKSSETEESEDAGKGDSPRDPPALKKKRPGHGRTPASDYVGAPRIDVKHETLQGGDPCPEGCKGKIYRLKKPRVVVCVTGQAPLTATVYEREALRCALCGKVFVAALPKGVKDIKFDEKTGSMIGLLKYGSGCPFNRLEGLQRNLKIPLPAATQWEIVKTASEFLAPAYKELLQQTAQAEVLHNDDTSMKILDHVKENRKRKKGAESKKERTGTFTSGIIATHKGRRMALFFTGRNHAGENMTQVLSARAKELGPPIQMCDALDRNLPDKQFETILGNCLSHGRRKFVDVVDNFPEACRFVLETMRDVYRIDARTQKLKMTHEKRLHFHQEYSQPLMDALEKWFHEQFDQKKVEPNSSLGEAIQYMTKRWDKFTLFLRKPGAPLDNNICERALKKAILHRKNSMFYKTENGARVGDIFMSLIHTAELSGANAFDYLTSLQKYASLLRKNPGEWMPWNYVDTLKSVESQKSA